MGSANVDTFLTVAALPRPGETVLASAMAVAPGGKGANQSVAAARAGAAVQFVGAVGQDRAAAELRAHLSANGVGLDGLAELSGPSGSAVVVVDGAGENLIVVAPGAGAHLSLASAAARAVIADCEVLMVSLEIPVDTAVAAAREARSVGATVILNASPAGGAELTELAGLADVVVLNATEEPSWRWPVPHLVVTSGASGVRYRGDGGDFALAAPPVEPVDTTGAGDVFAGVLAADWHLGVATALRRAVPAGAVSTLFAGAGDSAPTREAVDDALAERR